jgi:SAM-dependent methyltransferase
MGTGIASVLMIERGCKVLGVEPDPEMAKLARRHGFTVETATFEAWDAKARMFDLALCAQAWHWIDPTIGMGKLEAVLAPGGRAALIWNVGTLDPTIGPRLESVYAMQNLRLDRYSLLLGHADHGRIEEARRTLAASAAFETPSWHVFRGSVTYSPQGWCDHLLTHPDHCRLEPRVRDRLFDGLVEQIDACGGELTVQYDSHLITARRLPIPTRV